MSKQNVKEPKRRSPNIKDQGLWVNEPEKQVQFLYNKKKIHKKGFDLKCEFVVEIFANLQLLHEYLLVQLKSNIFSITFKHLASLIIHT